MIIKKCGKRRWMAALSLLLLVLFVGCGTRQTAEVDFYGVWDYPDYGVRIRISEDNTWEMLEETDTAVAGGDCIIDGDTAELYYTYGSPWGEEDGPVLYNVFYFEKTGELSDGIGYTLTLAE